MIPGVHKASKKGCYMQAWAPPRHPWVVWGWGMGANVGRAAENLNSRHLTTHPAGPGWTQGSRCFFPGAVAVVKVGTVPPPQRCYPAFPEHLLWA